MKLLILLKCLFSTTLLIVFFFFFGIPSFNKFQAREVLINKRKINTEDIAPPAITFCSGDGWKNVSDDSSNTEIQDYGFDSEILKHCQESNTFEEVLECIDTKTYNLTETIQMAYSEGLNSITHSTTLFL